MGRPWGKKELGTSADLKESHCGWSILRNDESKLRSGWAEREGPAHAVSHGHVKDCILVLVHKELLRVLQRSDIFK